MVGTGPAQAPEEEEAVMRRSTATLVPALAVLLVAGCPATRQARTVAPSGFLGADASLLEEGGEDDPKLYYVDPRATWSGYDGILLDPVTVWRNPATKGVSQSNAQTLANNFHGLLYAELAKDWTMAVAPGPRTLRLQVALTQLDGTDVVLNVVSTAVPQLRAVTGLEGYATGKPLFTGDAGMAFKVLDSTSGRLLAEGVDGRVGEKHLMDAWEKWSDVDAAMKYWAEMFRYDFCTLRGRADCPVPTTAKTF